MVAIIHEIRFALRLLRKHPGFSAIIILVLALGIGANATVFTLVNAVLFRPLPFPHGERVMVLFCNNPTKGEYRIGVSYPDFRDWRKQASSFDGLGAWVDLSVNLSDRTSTAERYAGTRVSANAFSIISQRPALGRDFTAMDTVPGAPPVAILGHALWTNRYGSNPSIIGQTVRFNDVPTVIVGVMPKGFRFPLSSDLWLPLVPTPAMEQRDARDLVVFGRLKQDSTLAASSSELNVIALRLEQSYPRTNQGMKVEINTFNDTFSASVRPLFLALLGAVGFVLLIACANVANLMLARSVGRSREMSIRTALGAGRWRVVRQLLIESLLYGVLGGVLGLAIGLGGVRVFDSAVSGVNKPYWIQFTMDYNVLAYIAGISILTGALFGVFPAVQISRVKLGTQLREGSKGSGTGAGSRLFSAGLVIAEMALAVVLLAAAGLLIRSFMKLANIQGAVNAAHLVTMNIELPDNRYPTLESRQQIRQKVVAGLAQVPGLEALALASNAPVQGSLNWKFQLPDQPPPAAGGKFAEISGLYITPQYFRAVGAPLLRGRGFNDADGVDGRNSAIVNHRFAARYWALQDPIGKSIRLIHGPGDSWYTVIGVSGDVKQNDPSQQPDLDPIVYLPDRENPADWAVVLARTRGDSATAIAGLRKRMRAIDESVPAFHAMTMDEVFNQQRWAYHVFGGMFVIFSSIALLLSAIGMYGVMAYSVAQRSRELGVRMALGASRSALLSAVLLPGAIQAGTGLVIGIAGALGAAGVLKSMLVEVGPNDPLTLISVSAVLGAAAILACWLPARRILKLDPAAVLRYE